MDAGRVPFSLYQVLYSRNKRTVKTAGKSYGVNNFMKTIVITGATRGIGFGLAVESLRKQHRVVISGRSETAALQAARQLEEMTGNPAVLGRACDVRELGQVQALWDAAVERFGRVDIWINNAGIGHAVTPSWKIEEDLVRAIVETNFLGTYHGCKVAINGMQAQGRGAVYNMEGYGSDGRIRMGLSIYGSTKSAVRFLSNSLVSELKGSPVILGTLQPGMVATEMVTGQYTGRPDEWQRVKKIFNIFVESVEAVSQPLTEKILANDRNGAQLRAFPRSRVYFRFLTAPFVKREVFK